MNANELADELRKSIYEQIANINFHDVADFICQQQAEIEALKAEKEKLFMGMLDMALDAEMKDLKNGN